MTKPLNFGRLPKDRGYQAFVGIRLTREQHRRLLRYVKRKGGTVSGCARALLFRGMDDEEKA